MKVPVLILLDWSATLYSVRYTPWEIDSDHPRSA